MTLQVNDDIEVNYHAVWKPAVVQKLFQVDGTDFLLAHGANGLHLRIMVINEYTVWRFPDAPVSA